MRKQALGILVLAAALGCQTSGGSSGNGEFEADSRSGDPGLSGRPGSERSMGRGDSPDGLGTIYFDYDQASLRADARQTLRQNADFLKQNPSSRVEIQGNCDERGSEEYNLALGMRRAEAARRYLTDLGVEPSRLRTISFGEERPAVRGHNEAAWARNRRGDFIVQ